MDIEKLKQRGIKLFHGSTYPVMAPVTNFKESKNGDFGKGFYATSNKLQAIKWGFRKLGDMSEGDFFYVSEYKFQPSEKLNIKIFKKPDQEWLETILKGRNGQSFPYDIIIGPVADARVNKVLAIYETKKQMMGDTLSLEEYRKKSECLIKEVLSLLNPEAFKDYDQYVFISDKSTKKLEFLKWTEYDSKKLPTKMLEKNGSSFVVREATKSERIEIKN